MTTLASLAAKKGWAKGRRSRELIRERDEIAALRAALAALADAAEDTLRSHPETECCGVTRSRCAAARALLASHT